MNQTKEKAFVLGLDGGSWDLLKPLMRQGYMPNLQKLCEHGVCGTLNSTIPPYTAPAWVSCVTGMNPGKHGVFGFTLKTGGGPKKVFVSSRAVKTPKIWHYLNEAEKIVGLINIPITYPVEKVDGFMLPCFLTPQGRTDFTYPLSLYEDLLKHTGDYIINVIIAGRKLDNDLQFKKFLDDILFATRKRFEAMKYLWTKYAADFFMIVFTCLDKIQHKFWKYLDADSPLYNSQTAEKWRPKIIEIYQLIDEIIGYVVEHIDNDTTLYIVSDHGFGPLEKRVFINKWLSQEGLLSLLKGKFYLTKMLARTKLQGISPLQRNISVAANPLMHCIDFPKTLFYGSDVYEQGIYFNHESPRLKSGDIAYENELNRLKEKLLLLKDPVDGGRFVDEVLFRDEVYHGPYVSHAPDMLLKMRNYSYLINTSVPLKEAGFCQAVKGAEGCHRLEGIFAAYGNGICQNKNIDASIIDITPTALYSMGLPVPKEIDGQVLKDIFTPAFQGTKEVVYSEKELVCEGEESKEAEYNSSEEVEIKAQLQDLGYLD